YDFGNGWKHRIRAEKSLSPHAYPCAPFAWPERMPVPPEDVGDPDGYIDFLRPLPAPAIPDRRNIPRMWRWVRSYCPRSRGHWQNAFSASSLDRQGGGR
ncbi:MAG: hypothetical protein DI596_09375, partial [Azospira oryzae]